MEKTDYRLGNYRITEYENSQIRWESHAAFGKYRSGKCYIIDDIIIIGNSDDEGNGYLVDEYFSQLKKLPDWNKTTYYCYIFELFDVVTGFSLRDDFLSRKLALKKVKYAIKNSEILKENDIFRLGKHRITYNGNDNITWETFDGINKIISGQCIIKSDLILLEPKQYEKTGLNKREFLNNLYQLPQWDKTMAWGHDSTLKFCIPLGNKTGISTWVQNMNMFVTHETFHKTSHNRYKEMIKFYRYILSRLKTWRSKISP